MKSTDLFSLFIVFMVGYSSLFAQNKSDLQDPGQYFDFWIGQWDVSWTDQEGQPGRGTNRVEKILGGKVILENFEAEQGSIKGFKGKSFSVYNPRAKKWKQTWVDNQQGYLDFTGRIEGDKRLFERSGLDPSGNPVKQRMVFYNIREDSFTWDWEISTDDGGSWDLRWRIHYKRAEDD